MEEKREEEYRSRGESQLMHKVIGWPGCCINPLV